MAALRREPNVTARKSLLRNHTLVGYGSRHL
jgi:hypothetical protein